MTTAQRVAFAVLCVAFLSAVPAAYALGFRWVNTPSVPMGLYRTSAASSAGRGAYACLLASGQHAPEALRAAVLGGVLPSEWKVQPLMKRVLAVGGDLVSYAHGRGVVINGALVPDSLRLESDRHGSPLPRPAYPVRLRPDEVWLGSGHARGFDSRYFGPVRVAALACVGAPAWTF